MLSVTLWLCFLLANCAQATVDLLSQADSIIETILQSDDPQFSQQQAELLLANYQQNNQHLSIEQQQRAIAAAAAAAAPSTPPSPPPPPPPNYQQIAPESSNNYNVPNYSAGTQHGYYYYYYPVQNSRLKKAMKNFMDMLSNFNFFDHLPSLIDRDGTSVTAKSFAFVTATVSLAGALLLLFPLVGISRRAVKLSRSSNFIKDEALNKFTDMLLVSMDKFKNSIGA